MFEAFPKLTRFSQDWTLTEKIDGSNAQILIEGDADALDGPTIRKHAVDKYNELFILAASRKRFLTADKQGDHMGFARWVQDHSHELIELLGPGRHFGEWWGHGIQRGYGLTEKRFSLFNVSRWEEEDVTHITGLHVVPVLSSIGVYLDCPGRTSQAILEMLKETGSKAAPGFKDPEGIVMYHGRSGVMFKKTYDYDEKGKWAELRP